MRFESGNFLMSHFEISFPGFLEGNMVIEDSIFNFTELFSILFQRLTDHLPGSPDSVTVPYSSMSFLFFHCLSYTFSVQFCFCSQQFLLRCRGLVEYFPSSERLGYHINFRPFAVRLFDIICSQVHELLDPLQFYLCFQSCLLFSPVCLACRGTCSQANWILPLSVSQNCRHQFM